MSVCRDRRSEINNKLRKSLKLVSAFLRCFGDRLRQQHKNMDNFLILSFYPYVDFRLTTVWLMILFLLLICISITSLTFYLKWYSKGSSVELLATDRHPENVEKQQYPTPCVQYELYLTPFNTFGKTG